MRTIYLIRHGEPTFPDGERFCLSKTDLPLSPVGRMQGALLREWLTDKPVSGVYHSRSSRAKETAEFLSAAAVAVDGLHEIGVGQWEGLTFREIREDYPELYAARGKNPITNPIPGGEAAAVCRNRAVRALDGLLKHTAGDIAVVAHAGVNRILLCELLERPLKHYLTIPQPYGCVNILEEDRGKWTVKEIGAQPHPALDSAACKRLLQAAGTPERVLRHCEAVAKKAVGLAQELESGMDLTKLRAAALLHDIARTEEDHAAVGAEWLTKLGYPELAALVAGHHELSQQQETELSEAAVLYLADKLIQEDREVTLERRFAESLEKVTTWAGRQVHTRRYQQAKRVARLLER